MVYKLDADALMLAQLRYHYLSSRHNASSI